ncbi:fibroblast growth factor receptor homolog 2 [Drosophila pseudoobscura]|uniref:receptor protein-tyrosine kinase n=1 Tax=Drosophila pseudoobscura pseudoobscura TaxID=46245 RepID=A0A6I8VJW6_DROPS|nr:fibroblast growth factor receptor homolog 2 [Drosophila pseudoobscura]
MAKLLITLMIIGIGYAAPPNACDLSQHRCLIDVTAEGGGTKLWHVPSDVDITLQCFRQQARWFFQDRPLYNGTFLRLERVQSRHSGSYGCVDSLNRWLNVTLKIGSPKEQADNDIASFAKVDPHPTPQQIPSGSSDTDLFFQPLNVSLSLPQMAQRLPDSVQRTAGGLFQLSCSPLKLDAVGVNISWLHNDTQVLGGRGRIKLKRWSLTVGLLQPEDAGTYRCQLCSVQGCTGSNPTQLEVTSRIHTAPVLRPGYPRNVSTALSDTVNFQCPLEDSQLQPQIKWLHQEIGGSIQLLVERLKEQSQDLPPDVQQLPTIKDEPEVLRLGHVQFEDAGWYICIAENQVGRTVGAAYLELHTALSTSTMRVDTTASTTTTTSLRANTLDTDDEADDAAGDATAGERPPVFKKQLERLQHSVAGKTITLSCPVAGNASITWTRDSKPLKRREGSYVLKKWKLLIDDATSDDSGIYTCQVCNGRGCIKFDFSVEINDRFRAPPIIMVPQNQTVQVNGSVTMECSVLSDLNPTVRWIRVVPRNRSEAGSRVESATAASEDADVVQIPLNTTLDQEHILQLNNVTHDHEGWYTCTSSTTLGTSNSSVYLRVVDYSPHMKVYALLHSHPLGFTVAAVMIVALFLLGSAFIVYMLRRLRREKLLKHRIETVHQWTKKVIIYRPASAEGSSCSAGDLQMPVIKIEKQRTTFSTTGPGSADSSQGFNEYEFPLDSNWEIPRQQLSLGSILGEGAFGRVVMAEAEGLPRSPNMAETIVAVKMVKEEHTDADMASLVREMEVMKMIGKHINIINLLGCCSQGGPLWVIVEFAPHGNLKDFLKQNRPGAPQRRSDSDGYLDDKPLMPQQHLGEKELTKFAFQIARGMEYLASRRCIHRDLAARNVLVSDGYVMKIADFGLARDIQDTDYYRKNTNGRLPIKWMAPESLQEKKYDSQSDVWSYGVLLWEIMTYGEQPYPQIMSAEELYSYLITGQRMEKPSKCSLNIYVVMRQCWHFESCARPTFSELVESFDGILQQASSNPNDAYLDVSMSMLETPPSSGDEDDSSETETFRETLPLRYQYTYKFN